MSQILLARHQMESIFHVGGTFERESREKCERDERRHLERDSQSNSASDSTDYRFADRRETQARGCTSRHVSSRARSCR